MHPPFKTSSLLTLPSIQHGFFGREGGVSTGLYASLNVGYGSSDSREAISENRRRALAAVTSNEAINVTLVTLKQVHSADVVTVDTPWTPENAPEADALVTATPGIALGIQTADCGTILLADAEAGVIGGIHAGWKGALAGIIGHTVQAMQRLGAQPNNIRAALGACIHPVSYQVDKGFYKTFGEAATAYQTFFQDDTETPGCYRFDLPRFCLFQLYNAGVTQVDDLAQDTLTQPDVYFSYRRSTLNKEADYGRQLSVIVLS
ncbi:MAG: peptidoglycan editing factor PgeF [Thalassospira sp.]|nr:peptidoglycan editing factor PgeF [Thalassospira sp.]